MTRYIDMTNITMPKFDVWMDSGVCVAVRRGTDHNTPEGVEIIKAAAIAKFRTMLDSGEIDVTIEPFDADDN